MWLIWVAVWWFAVDLVRRWAGVLMWVVVGGLFGCLLVAWW